MLRRRQHTNVRVLYLLCIVLVKLITITIQNYAFVRDSLLDPEIMLISLYLFLSVAVADQFRNKECREIAFVTTIRTSEYFEDTLSSRGGVISYRVFRENLLAHNDLIAAVVVDATVSRQNMIYLLSDLRSYEVRFVLFPAEEGHMDLTPNYHYALRAFRSMREKSAACHVMYISPHSIFFKDPTSLIMESIALQPGPPKDILCMRHVYRIDRADTDDFLTASGSTDEVIRIVQLNRSRGHYNVFCSPDMVLFANLSLLPQLMDITDSLVSSYYFYRRYNLQVMGTALESAMGRHDYESILLQTALCTMYHSSSLHGNIGFLPSYAGTDLSAMSSQENADYDLFILISPPLLGNDNRVLLTFGGGQCTIDVSAWNYLSTSLNTEKYSKLAGMAVKYFETTQYACELFANSVSAVPFGDFLEFGSKTVSAVALPWHYGYSISAATGGGDNDTDIAAFAVGLEEVSAMSGPRSFMLLHYHSSPSSIAVAEMNINQTTQTAQKWLNEVISYFEGIPHTELHLVQRRLPCAIWVDSASTNENNHENTDFSVCEFLLSLYESRLYRLGLIPVNQLCQTHPVRFL